VGGSADCRPLIQCIHVTSGPPHKLTHSDTHTHTTAAPPFVGMTNVWDISAHLSGLKAQKPIPPAHHNTQKKATRTKQQKNTTKVREVGKNS